MNDLINQILVRERITELQDAADSVRIDGATVRLRSLRPEDRDGMLDLLGRLSPDSIYRRFLSPKPRLTKRELEYLVNVDGSDHVAIGAVDPRQGRIVGVGRYIRDRNRPGVADVAIEVADDLHGRGIGTVLARRLVDHACAGGLSRLTAAALRENVPARALLRRLGFCAEASDGAVIDFELGLDSCGQNG
jgi:RimJ/RimL family protein N-acetyltransferase